MNNQKITEDRSYKKLRVFHGPANVAGIGRILSDWQRENRSNSSDFITYSSDSVIARASHFSWRLESSGVLVKSFICFTFFLQCLLKYDVFNFYFGSSLLPRNLDLPILRLFGKKIVMIYCGSDIRLMEVERKRHPFWHLIKGEQDGLEYDKRKKRMMRWHRLWVHRVFAPRELYDSAAEVFPKKMIEKDLWVHNLINIKKYRPVTYKERKIPVLVHAPSHQGLKGTKYIENAIQDLRAEGVKFEYRRIEGVSHQEAMRIYKEDADIIVDQLLIGSFGTLAVEGMCFGKSVVCYMLDDVRQKEYPNVPIVSATVENIKEKLHWLIDNPEVRERLRHEGRSYVEKHFDCDVVNQKLWDLYENL